MAKSGYQGAGGAYYGEDYGYGDPTGGGYPVPYGSYAEFGHGDGGEYGDNSATGGSGNGGTSAGMSEIGMGSIHLEGAYGYDGVSNVCFDSLEETVWVGSAGGTVYQQVCPTLEGYGYITAHEGPVISMASLGHGVASLSVGQFCVHTSGCGPRVTYLDSVGDLGDFSYQHWNHRAILGRHGGGIFVYDVAKGRRGEEYQSGHGVGGLSGPLARGQLAAASPDGYLTLLDIRQGKMASIADMKVYPHGFQGLDCSDNLVATTGYGGRPERPVLEPVVRVFDVRMGLRILSTLPCSSGPTALKFHPKLNSSLLVCSSNGMFSLMEASGMDGAAQSSYYVDMKGDSVVDCDVSATGDCFIFAGMQGFLSMWSQNKNTFCSSGGIHPEYPSEYDRSIIPQMDETCSFSQIPVYVCPDGMQFASAVSEKEVMSVGLPPRVVDSSLLNTGKVSDFVTYIKNPKFDSNKPPGAAAAAISAVRNKRVQHRRTGRETVVAIDERAKRRAKEGGIVLPKKFRKVFIRHQTGTRFEEFDFKAYNETQFSGLENGLANCYTNALFQVLYFTRALRDFVVQHTIDSNEEFSLLGELSFLFRMLGTAGGEICQVGFYTLLYHFIQIEM